MRDPSWVIATGNAHKLQEIESVLGAIGLACVGLRDLDGAPTVEEWGDTFAVNAALKATEIAAWSGRVTLADDSGLEVDAFSGAPGVHSARWSGVDATDVTNNERLVEELRQRGLIESSGRFRCVMALCWPNGVDAPAALAGDARAVEDETDIGPDGLWSLPGGVIVATFSGVMEGQVTVQRRGTGGFGYDPHFVLSDGRHLAELRRDEKSEISHRGLALRALTRVIGATSIGR